jgi:CheY-like chemotaxis protein
MKFLIVDDSDVKAEKAKEALNGHTCDRAKSYRSAILSMLDNAYDGVILDMGLPLRDDEFRSLKEDQGLNVLREMKRNGLNIPTVIYSTNQFDVSKFDFVKGYIVADFSVSIDRDIQNFISSL